MSHQRTLQEDSQTEELDDLIRKLDITHGSQLQSSIHSSISAHCATGSHPVTPSRPEEVINDESRDCDEGGVSLSAHPEETLSDRAPSSLASCTSFPASSTDQVDRIMTPMEKEIWVRYHNNSFLESLNSSVVARNNVAAPQTPSPRSSRTASRLHIAPSSSTASHDPPYSGLSRDHAHRITLTPFTPSSDVVRTPPSALSHAPHPFRPNYMVLERMGVRHTPTPQQNHGSNYLGRRHLSPSAREVQGLPNWENCALFLTSIPAEATLCEVFSVINTGAVFCLQLNPPTGIHTNQAAKLVFMKPEDAAAFLQQTRSFEGVVLHGKRIEARYNRNGYKRNENIWQSRVLEIVGPTPMMTLRYWTSYFANFSEFELDAYRLIPTNVPGVTILEFRFARIDGQAQTCLQCIRTDPSLAGIVQARYGADPCGFLAAC